MSKKKVYGVVRSGNGKSIVCCIKEVRSVGCPQTSPGLVTKERALDFVANMDANYRHEGYTYTVFKMKFKETI